MLDLCVYACVSAVCRCVGCGCIVCVGAGGCVATAEAEVR